MYIIKYELTRKVMSLIKKISSESIRIPAYELPADSHLQKIADEIIITVLDDYSEFSGCHVKEKNGRIERDFK